MKMLKIEMKNSFRFYESLFCAMENNNMSGMPYIYNKELRDMSKFRFFQICLQGMERKSRKDELNMTQYAAG